MESAAAGENLSTSQVKSMKECGNIVNSLEAEKTIEKIEEELKDLIMIS